MGDGGLHGGLRVGAGVHLMARGEAGAGISRMVHCRDGGHRDGQDAGGGVVSVQTLQRDVSQIQMEMGQLPTHEAKLAMWSGGLYAVGLPLPDGIASPQYFKTLRSSWIHQHGIGGAQVLIILTIMGSRILWERRGPDCRFWSRAQWVVLLFVVGGEIGRAHV